jgi:hypothetical protein
MGLVGSLESRMQVSVCRLRAEFELSVTDRVPEDLASWFWSYGSGSVEEGNTVFFVPHYKQYMLVPTVEFDAGKGENTLLCQGLGSL